MWQSPVGVYAGVDFSDLLNDQSPVLGLQD